MERFSYKGGCGICLLMHLKKLVWAIDKQFQLFSIVLLLIPLMYELNNKAILRFKIIIVYVAAWSLVTIIIFH